jgi:OHCU decarboxylase
MMISEFDHLNRAEKANLLQQCCGSTTWINKMIEAPPAEDLVDILEIAEEQWYACKQEDWLEAFSHHPRIGDQEGLRNKITESEQVFVQNASEQTLQQLAAANAAYEQKFGHIFIISATGKSAEEILTQLNTRLQNNADTEINNAMEEQLKIIKLHIEKLFTT